LDAALVSTGPNPASPSAHRFIGDIEPSFGQQFLDVSITQGEAEIQPDGVLDDLGREAMAAVAIIALRSRRSRSMPRRSRRRSPVNLEVRDRGC
jgi:hypothetical protein